MRVAPADSRTHKTREYSQRQDNDRRNHSCSLSELQRRVGKHFTRPEPRERAMTYLTGLLSGVPRKNGHTLAAYAQETASDGMQRLLTTAKWDVDAVRDELRSCVLEWFGDKRSLLVAGQASFIKRGRHSAGVHQQYCEESGRLENCQVGIFLSYVSPTGTAFIDRELYLPDEWRGDARRRARAGVPDLAFASRVDLARRMLGRALHSDIPASWVVTSEMADVGVPLHEWLQRAQMPNVVEIRATAPLRVTIGDRTVRMSAGDLMRTVPARQWQAMCTRRDKWRRLALAASLDNSTVCWLLLRFNPDGSLATCYAASGPAPTSLAELAWAAAAGATARQALSRAKARVGLDHYEARRYEAWYRHVTLALMADALAEAQTAALAGTHTAALTGTRPAVSQAPWSALPGRERQGPGASRVLVHSTASRWPVYLWHARQPARTT